MKTTSKNKNVPHTKVELTREPGKELTSEQLEQVNGGLFSKASHFSGYVYKYDGIREHEYYFSRSDCSSEWFRGILKRSWEKSIGICQIRSIRTHEVYITEDHDALSYKKGNTSEVDGDIWLMYTTKE